MQMHTQNLGKQIAYCLAVLVIPSLLTSCIPESISTACPTLVDYSQAEQDKIADFVQFHKGDQNIKEVLKEYYKLREACRGLQ
jgi:hypothetical protein